MPIEKLVALNLPPGAYRNGTKYQAKGRFFDTNLVRWLEGILRPVGGWVAIQWSAAGISVNDTNNQGTSGETIIVSDTFFETAAGVLLENHTPVGSPNPFTWLTDASTTSASLVIDTATGILLPRNDETLTDWPQYTESFALGGPDYEVSVDALVRNSTHSTDFGGVGARLTGGTQQGGYAFGIVEDPGQPQYALYVFDTDGSLISGTTVPVPASDLGTVVTLSIRCFGSTIGGYVNGVQTIEITDTTYPNEGRPGLVLGWVPHSITTTVSSGSGSQFTWFKQTGYYPVIFNSNTLVCFNSFCPTHTVGVPTGHIGDAAPVLPTDYEVSVVVHTHAAAGNGGAPPYGAGVIARCPLSAAFNDTSGYYFVYNAAAGKYRLIAAQGPGNVFDGATILWSASTDVPGGDLDTDITMSLKVEGSTITGLVNSVAVLTTSDTTFASGGRAGVIVPWQAGHGAYVKGNWTVFDLSTTPQLLLSDTLVDTDGVILEGGHIPVPIDPITDTTTTVVDTDLGFRAPFEARRIVTPTPPTTTTSELFADLCLAGLPRGSHSWHTNDGVSWFAVGTTTDAYKYSDGILFGLAPWKASTSTAHSWADTPFGAAHVDGVFGTGNYGRGPYGLGLYGVGTGALTLIDADTWTLDNFGEQLVGCFTLSEEIYEDVGDTFVLVPNAPSAKAIICTPERFLFALGADNDSRKVAWCDQGDLTAWTPSATNQAGAYFLTTRGRLKCGMRTRRQTLLWTDADVHAATYIGGDFIYAFEQLGDHCGIISPHAAAVVGDIAYWMSYGRFFVYDGAVKPLSCDVLDYVFGDLSQQQRAKIWAMSMTQFDEIWWFYPTASQTGTECDRYVVYNYRDGAWYFGQLARGTGVDRDVFEFPLMVGNTEVPPDSNCVKIYQHEYGDNRDGLAFAETGPLELGGTAKSGPMSDSYYGDQGGSLQRVQHIIPDDKTEGDVRFYVYTSNYPNLTEKEFGPFLAKDPTAIRFTARQIRVRYEEDKGKPPESWRVGVPRLGVLPAGRR